MNIILDIDGTLWNTTEIVADAWNDATCDVGLESRYGRFITADMLKKEFGKPMDTIVTDLYLGLEPELINTVLTAVKAREKKALSNIKNDLSYPQVKETICSLCNKFNHKIYIVSNCQEGYIPLVMDKLEIKEFISDYESFGNTGLSKSENIKLVLNRNNDDFSQSYYVGDTYGDYLATTDAGITFIHASYGFGEMDVNYNGLSIRTFSDLINLFNELV